MRRVGDPSLHPSQISGSHKLLPGSTQTSTFPGPLGTVLTISFISLFPTPSESSKTDSQIRPEILNQRLG
jgi:hypothetical protein